MTDKVMMKVDQIQNRIFTIRDSQVMIDRDLAELYQVKTKTLNQSVKRNSERFPHNFMFQLNDNEKLELVTNCDRLINKKATSCCPNLFWL